MDHRHAWEPLLAQGQADTVGGQADRQIVGPVQGVHQPGPRVVAGQLPCLFGGTVNARWACARSRWPAASAAPVATARACSKSRLTFRCIVTSSLSYPNAV